MSAAAASVATALLLAVVAHARDDYQMAAGVSGFEYYFQAATRTGIASGEPWTDTAGDLIQAHGGGIFHHQGTYYWYGENKAGPTYQPDERFPARVDVIGISCYSSPDLLTWTNHGLVLAHSPDPESDLHPSRVVERPKVLYNDATGKFVLWVHIDSPTYEAARVGVAVASSPTGRFDYIGSFRPHGTESRDFTIFKEDDGTAYVIYSSETNMVMHISELTDDYTGVKPEFWRVLINLQREAPAVFTHEGLYYLVTSGCTGWWPNAAEVHVSHSMKGPWHSIGNPCRSTNSTLRSTTFNSQGSFVLPLPGKPGSFMFMADRWNVNHLGHSRYVWLPLEINNSAAGNKILQALPVEEKLKWSAVSIRWLDNWTPLDM